MPYLILSVLLIHSLLYYLIRGTDVGGREAGVPCGRGAAVGRDDRLPLPPGPP